MHNGRCLVALLTLLACCTLSLAEEPVAAPAPVLAPPASSTPFVLGPPEQERPVVVHAAFRMNDVNEILDGTETFEFTGVMTLRWKDPRQAFDPVVEGVQEKVFQGAFQVDEISPGWYPQLVLVNESGSYESSGVVLRVLPDGTSTQIQTVNAIAESKFDYRLFPFDSQHLEAVFEVLGFGRDEVVLRVDPANDTTSAGAVEIPQWNVRGITLSEQPHPTTLAGRSAEASRLVVSIDVVRQSWYARRLLVVPVVIIVLLSFSIFWMDRSTLGDRQSVSFVGILTAVAYQMVMADQLPRISYFTLMHGFIGVSFMTMCATVVINLVVGTLDRRGKHALGDRIDRNCRWMFPLMYFGLVLGMLGFERLLLG